MMHFIRFITILLFTLALFGQQTASTPADHFAQRLHGIAANAQKTTPDTAPTDLPDDEGNAYFTAGRVKLPASVRSLHYKTSPGVVAVDARIDFDQITANAHSMNPLLSFFSGVHDVHVEADAFAQQNVATVKVRTVEIDGVVIPQIALEYFAKKYLTPRWPNVGTTSTFKLGFRIDRAQVLAGKARVWQK